jgi:hypothetical protein
VGTSAARRPLRIVAASAVVSFAFAAALGGEEMPEFPKRIAKEPAYTAPVQYFALFVLGHDGDTRVWMVADGDRLYVDSNGNGDLTEPGERFDSFRSSQGNEIPLRRTWKVRKLAVSDRYTDLEISIGLWSPKWRPAATAPNAAEMTGFIEAYAKAPGANWTAVHVGVGARTWTCDAMWGTSKVAAPVFRMDTRSFDLGVIESLVPHVLSRRRELETLSVGVGAPGFGGAQPGCFSWVDCHEFGNFARPVADIEFPAGDGTYLPVRRYVLSSSC